jgi:hypothetical protein
VWLDCFLKMTSFVGSVAVAIVGFIFFCANILFYFIEKVFQTKASINYDKSVVIITGCDSGQLELTILLAQLPPYLCPCLCLSLSCLSLSCLSLSSVVPRFW